MVEKSLCQLHFFYRGASPPSILKLVLRSFFFINAFAKLWKQSLLRVVALLLWLLLPQHVQFSTRKTRLARSSFLSGQRMKQPEQSHATPFYQDDIERYMYKYIYLHIYSCLVHRTKTNKGRDNKIQHQIAFRFLLRLFYLLKWTLCR